MDTTRLLPTVTISSAELKPHILQLMMLITSALKKASYEPKFQACSDKKMLFHVGENEKYSTQGLVDTQHTICLGT